MKKIKTTLILSALLLLTSGIAAAQPFDVSEIDETREDSLPHFEISECPFDTASINVEGLRCGYLTVPENREKDNGRNLRLAVAIAEPAEATGDPVVLLPGGPGGGPLPGFIERLRLWVPPDRTVVIFDPRGTGFSGPVMCPELSETSSAIASLDLTTEQAAALQRGAYLACRDRLLRQGIDLGSYNSTTIALDLKVLREALGYDQWNIMSGSYGVPFARSAMRVDSAGIRSAVLAIGPGPVITDLLRRDIPFFAKALERVFRGCAAEAACAEVFPDLESDFYRTYESLREEPLTVSVDPGEFHGTMFTVNAQEFVRMIYWELTSETGVAFLPGLIGAFRDRDKDVVRKMVERGYGGLKSKSSRMGTSVLCYDAHTPQSRREWEESATPFHPALAEIEYFLLPCEDWSEERASEKERRPQQSEIPTLVITGEYDPMNPPVTGDEHLRWLPNGYHVVIPGMGHMPTARSAACWGILIEQFVENPTQHPDVSCTEELPEVRIGPDLPDWTQPAGVSQNRQRMGEQR